MVHLLHRLSMDATSVCKLITRLLSSTFLPIHKDDQVSVGQGSVGQVSVGQVSAGQGSVGQGSTLQMCTGVGVGWHC